MPVALVVGGNRRIGRAAVRQLAASGFKVWLGSRDPRRGRDPETELRAGTAAPMHPSWKIGLTMLVLVSTAIAAAPALAAPCAAPHGFVDTPPPAVAPADQLVAHTEDIDIGRPLAAVLDVVNHKSLEHAVHGSGAMPGVAGTYPLTRSDFGRPGSRRITCLTDGSTLVEQAVQRRTTANSYHFRYVVWNYTARVARPIAYGVGDFRFTAMGPDRTHVHWVYAFQLRRDRFPGYLGGLGALLFRVGFLDRQYADLMRSTLAGYRSDSEQGAGSRGAGL